MSILASSDLRARYDFRFKYRMPSRASAVRELLSRGLSAEGFSVPTPGAHSSEFGVTDDK